MALVYDGALATAAAAMLAILVRPRLPGFAREGAAGLKTVPQQAGTVYCLIGENGHIRSITANARQILGEACDRAAELDLTLVELLQPGDAAQVEEWVDRAWLTQPLDARRVVTRGPDGGARWIELSSPGRTAPSGDTVLVEIRDVSAHATRDRQNMVLSHAVEHAVDAMYIIDAEGRIEYANAAFARLSGYRAADMIGRPCSMLASGEQGADFGERMWERLRQGTAYTGEVINRRPNDTRYTVDLTISPLAADDTGTVRYLAVARDVTERKRQDRAQEDLAYYDALTGLASHRLLRERAGHVLALARRHGRTAALLHIDLERLRWINDQHGRATGDEVLRTVAERLRQSLRDSDTLARIGSDEFLVLLSEVSDTDAVARVVRRLHEAITRPLRIQQLTLNVSARIGVSVYPQDAGNYEQLLHCASAALQRAEHATSSFEFFDHGVSAATHDRLLLEDDLRWAWEHDQFVLHYQPIVGADGVQAGEDALVRGHVVGVEALARWPHLERGMLGPAEFIPVAERTGRIVALDRWAIATAVRQAAAWSQSGWDGWISVNLSARTLQDPELAGHVQRVLAAHDLGRSRLVVEVTEHSALRDPKMTVRALEALRDAGVLIAIDDFGAAHSSLSFLQQFPVDLLKLDASFVRDIASGGRDERLVEVLISLAHGIGAKVVAVGVEAEDQLQHLRSAGCDYVQGYIVGRPAPPATLPQHDLPE